MMIYQVSNPKYTAKSQNNQPYTEQTQQKSLENAKAVDAGKRAQERKEAEVFQ